jgi:hypothetical protein
MPTENLTNEVARRVERSRFLRRLGGVALVPLAATLARPENAHAATCCENPPCWNQHGCNLCCKPGAYGGTPCPPSLTCVWCWIGECHTHNGVPNRKHYCCEGHTNANCGSGCTGVVCSYLSGTYAC